MRMGKKAKPVLFEVFPNIEARVQEFVMEHLDWFCVEMIRDELIFVPHPLLTYYFSTCHLIFHVSDMDHRKIDCRLAKTNILVQNYVGFYIHNTSDRPPQ